MKVQRKSGIELLRIIAIFGVIMIHYYEAVNDFAADPLPVHSLVLLRSLSASAVDVFIVISGYFLVSSNTRKLGKALTLFVQVSLFSEISYFANVAAGVYDLSLRHIVSSLIPQSYYTTLYVVLYFISPYLNVVLNRLNIRDLRVMTVSLFACFSIYSILITFYSEIVNVQWFGLNPVGAWGSQQGFNIVNFVLLYIIGAFIRISRLDEKISCRRSVLVFFILTSLIICWAEINQVLPHFGQISAWCYDNPFVILQGLFLFFVFKKLNIVSKYINRLATAAYTVFIIHYIVLSNMSSLFFYKGMTITDLVLRYVLFAITIYILSWIIYEIYNYATKRFFNKCDKIEFPYFSNRNEDNISY